MEDATAWPWIVFWWVAFGGSHLLLSSARVRGRIVGRVGEQPFLGIYSLVALATFVPMVASYWGRQHTGPLLWSLLGIPGAEAVGIAIGTFAFALLVSSFMQPSPAGMDPRAEVRASGITRVTRHPLMSAFALWGIGHVLINGFASDLAFFGGFIVFAVVGAAHQDARKRADRGEELADFYEETSFIPFAAIVAGRNRLVVGELPWLGLAAGAGAGIAIYLLHPWLFG